MIVGVAILKDGIIYALPRPARHCHLFAEFNNGQRETVARKQAAGEAVPPGWLTTFAGWPETTLRGGEQGFVNEQGDFLNRVDAAAHAYLIGMIAKPEAQLYSESVW
jgi:hypothetical protein